jgi:phage portal protein BeeE
VGKGRRRQRSAAKGGPSGTGSPALAHRHQLTGGILGHEAWTSGQSISEAMALGVDTVFACVTLIADAVAQADWGEWRGNLELPPSRITRRPMEGLTRREWTWLVTATLALYNACPVRLSSELDSEGVPMSLVPVPTARRVAGRWIVDGSPTDDDIRLIRRTVFPTVGADAAATIRLARQVFAAAVAQGDYLADWWTSGGAPLTVLTSDDELSNAQAELIASRWVERRKLGPGSAPAVLGKGAHAEAFGADPEASGAGSSADRVAASIARYFRVAPHLVNVPSYASNLTYQNTEGASTDLVRYTLTAYADPIADFLSELLPGDYITGRQVRLSLRRLLMAELESRARAWSLALDPDRAWITQAEVRELEGLPPIEQAAAQAETPIPATAEGIA